MVGPLTTLQPVRIDVEMAEPDPGALNAFVAAVSTPGSPDYRHYLTKGAFASRFGPSDSSLDSVRAWLSAQGLRVGTTSSNGLLVPATGTAAQVSAAFATDLTSLRLSSGGTAYAATATPSVPSSLANVVSGVSGLDDLPVAPPHASLAPAPESLAPATSSPTPHATTPSGVPIPAACGAPQGAASQGGGLTQPQIADAYGLSTLFNQGRLGYGETIALPEIDTYTSGDIATFEQCFGLTTSVRNVDVDGGEEADGETGEAPLDVEQIASLAPGASIVTYTTQNAGNGELDAFAAIADDDSAQVVSIEYGRVRSGGREWRWSRSADLRPDGSAGPDGRRGGGGLGFRGV